MENLLIEIASKRMKQTQRYDIYQQIRQISISHFGLLLSAEYVSNLVLSENQFFRLIQKEKALLQAKNKNHTRTAKTNCNRMGNANIVYSADQEGNTIPINSFLHRQAIDKQINRELKLTRQAIKELKNPLSENHADTFAKYNTIMFCIRQMTKYRNPVPYVRLWSCDHDVKNGFCEIHNKQHDRRQAKIQKMSYLDYMGKRENDKLKISLWTDRRMNKKEVKTDKDQAIEQKEAIETVYNDKLQEILKLLA